MGDGGRVKDAMRMATRKHSILALLVLVLAVTTCLSPVRTSSDFTDTMTRLNPFGSCPLVKGKYDGASKWTFDAPPCGYLGTTCWDLSPSLDSACTSPWPNTNIVDSGGTETVIAMYYNGLGPGVEGASAQCPLNLTEYDDLYGDEGKTVEFGCPLTCLDCATLCKAQAASVAKKGDFYDPTLQGCNAWVFCTNPQGCPHGDKVAPGLSCTLKRIDIDSPSIREAMAPGYFQEVFKAPEALVDKSSSGPGSDFVSGLCNVRETCTNSKSMTCSSGCGNSSAYSCWGFPMTCSDGCLPSCPC